MQSLVKSKFDEASSEEQRLKWIASILSSDLDLARTKVRAMIDEGSVEAYALAGLVEEKRGDYPAAYFYYDRGTSLSGNVECWLGKARLLLSGKLGPPDFAEARRCYEVVVEDLEHMVAQLMLGIIHDHGLGVAQDWSKAAKYYEAAADQGSVPAQTQLARVLKRTGRPAKAYLLRLRAILSAVRIAAADSSDVRLRSDLIYEIPESVR